MKNKDLFYFHLLNDTFKYGKSHQIAKLHDILVSKLIEDDCYLNIATCRFNK